MVEKGNFVSAREVAASELSKINQDPQEVFKKVEEGILKFIEKKDTSLWDEYLDQPKNRRINDILTRERQEFRQNSILGLIRQEIEQRRKEQKL